MDPVAGEALAEESVARRAWVRAVLAGEARTFEAWSSGSVGSAGSVGEACVTSDDVASDDLPASAPALELVRRVNQALPVGEPGSLRERLRADVVADVLRLAPRDPAATGATDEVDAALVGDLLAGVFERAIALVDEARAEVARG